MRVISCGGGYGYIFGALMITVNKVGGFVDATIFDNEVEHIKVLPPHGTQARYRTCKCEACTKANSDYHKARRAMKK